MVEPSDAIAMLRERGMTVSTGESLTGGLLCSRLIDVPGASDAVLGGVVAYASSAKVELLGVSAETIDEQGTVSAEVARQLAEGSVHRFGSDWGIGTTGVAGPDPSEGKPVGTVFIGIAGPDGTDVLALRLSGDRSRVRQRTVEAACAAIVARLKEEKAL